MQSGKPWVSGNLSSYTSLATAAENESEQAGFVLSILQISSQTWTASFMNTFCLVEITTELPFIKCLLGTRHWPEYFTNISSFNPQDGLVREIWRFRTHTLRQYTVPWMPYSLEVEKSRFELRADSKVQCKKCLQASRVFQGVRWLSKKRPSRKR